MGFDRHPLPLGRGPRGGHEARRWVAQACLDAGRPELVEAAQLAVSELVTNALLHAAPPIDVRLGGTPDHPRFEVRDGSTVPPEVPEASTAPAAPDLEALLADDADGSGADVDPDALLADFDPDQLLTFGRGLDLVARASDAWGVDIDDSGKAVWFEPAAEIAEGAGATCQITGAPQHVDEATVGPDSVVVAVLGVPVDTFARFEQHYREVRREVRLLALAHEEDYPLAKNLADVFGTLDRPLRHGIGRRQVEQARAEGRPQVDLSVVLSRREAEGLAQLAEVLELADAFCRNERLLTLARSEEQEAFQRWFLGEFVRQADGADPLPWSSQWTGPAAVRRSSAS